MYIMIITHKSSPSDWKWLRGVFDGYMCAYRNKYHIPNDEFIHNTSISDCAAKYARNKMIPMGVRTLPHVNKPLGSHYICDSYYGREFNVVNMDKFLVAKLSR